MQVLNETIEANDATIKVVEQHGETIHGKTVDSCGDAIAWEYDGETIEWVAEPSYYLQVKTEETLEGMDLGLQSYEGPGLSSFCTGWDIECSRCDYVGPMNIWKKEPDMDSKTMHVCPECGRNNA